MPTDHVTRPLTVGEIPIAFPLIQQLHGDAVYEDWERFARAHIEPRLQGTDEPRARPRGIVVAENQLGYLQGMFCYVLRPEALCGPTLQCDQFVALGLLTLDSPLTKLLDAAERIAKQNGSRRIEVQFSNAQMTDAPVRSHLHHMLSDWGHRMQSLGYCKSLG